MKLYHGSPRKHLKSLESQHGSTIENLEGEGIYFTTDFELAKSYATCDSGVGSVYTVEIDDSELLDLTTEDGRERFFDEISSQVNYDLRSHDNFNMFKNFLEAKRGSPNGIRTLAEDVVEILKKTSSVNSSDKKQGKKDLRERADFEELCRNVRQSIQNEISKYELHHFKADHELIYVLKRASIEVIKEENVTKA